MKKTYAIPALLSACVLACGQDASGLFKPDPVAMEILRPIDQAISGVASNSPYLTSWDTTKTNLHWTTEGKHVVGAAMHYAHNIQKTGPLATNIVYGTNACLVHVSAPMKHTWSGLGVKTRIAGEIGNRDILISVQTWNPESSQTERALLRIVQHGIETLKKTISPNKESEATR